MAINHHKLAAKLRRLATELEEIYPLIRPLFIRSRKANYALAAFHNSLDIMVKVFRQIADQIKPPKGTK